MKRFKSAEQAQRFLSVHDQVANPFHIPYPESVTAAFRRASSERALSFWRAISKAGTLPDVTCQNNGLPSVRHSLNLTVPLPELFPTGTAS
jgi:putative transposase